ncbi:hypothetical protein [uncultured Roseobacter sp.]|uniref:hypothetical protein n=1 Tax=uncultured Roseobacter sp. TaxID=114847 RepID=UPI0026295F0F|nr:hypothetical protein [uncultured Roseobacter sp.]
MKSLRFVHAFKIVIAPPEVNAAGAKDAPTQFREPKIHDICTSVGHIDEIMINLKT